MDRSAALALVVDPTRWKGGASPETRFHPFHRVGGTRGGGSTPRWKPVTGAVERAVEAFEGAVEGRWKALEWAVEGHDTPPTITSRDRRCEGGPSS